MVNTKAFGDEQKRYWKRLQIEGTSTEYNKKIFSTDCPSNQRRGSVDKAFIENEEPPHSTTKKSRSKEISRAKKCVVANFSWHLRSIVLKLAEGNSRTPSLMYDVGINWLNGAKWIRRHPEQKEGPLARHKDERIRTSNMEWIIPGYLTVIESLPIPQILCFFLLFCFNVVILK